MQRNETKIKMLPDDKKEKKMVAKDVIKQELWKSREAKQK